MLSVDSVFEPAPQQWGLRGDMVLWEKMQARLAGVPLGTDPERIRDLLGAVFTEITGVDLDNSASVEIAYCEELKKDGLSNGQIHLPSWEDTYMPLLMHRVLLGCK